MATSLTGGPKYVDLTLDRAIQLEGDMSVMELHRRLQGRISDLATEQELFKTMADRFDEIYYSTVFSDWGADVWADDESANTPGRSHLSVNTFSIYVDVPASLQAYEPVENMLSFEDEEDMRIAAQSMERVRMAWKAEEKWQLKRHKAAIVKGLYGKTASYVYYDKEQKRACADVIQNPRNLYLGYKTTDYEELEWAAYLTRMDPMAVIEEFSVAISARDAGDGKIVPWIGDAVTEPDIHPEMTFGPARIDVWDYWYRVPGKRGKRGEPTKMETWNVVIAGNRVVREPRKYAAYDGELPYKPLFNTFIPGMPLGRSDLHDMEMLIREKMVRLSQGAQMIAKAAAGDYWQLIGENPPAKLSGVQRPKVNDVAIPGPGNRIEAINPFVIQVQLEQYLGRIDREMAVVSGLNDLLLGLSPTAVLNSSKAINALVANYESRIAMRRLLFYQWDKDTWDLCVKVWQKYDKNLAKVVDAGGGVLEITAPSLSPRDEFETAQRAINLMQNKLWSQARGMDAVGVDDPEQEQNIIRAERTDATLFPADVQTMAQLMGALQSLGLQPSQQTQQQVGAQGASGTEALRQSLGGAPGVEGAQYGTQEQTPPITGAPAEAGGGPFAQASSPEGATAQLQSMTQNGETKGRIMTNRPLGRK